MIRELTVVLALLSLAASAAAEPRIVISAHGVPGGTNLVRDPGFEEGGVGWHAGSASPESVYAVWSDAPISGDRSAGIRAEIPAASGYWVQEVPVEPATGYLLSARMDLREGKVLVRANGRGFDARKYTVRQPDLLTVPVFWKPQWVRGHDLSPGDQIFLTFTTGPEGDPQSVNIALGLYFSRGLVFFDDLYLGPGTLTVEYTVGGDDVTQVRVLDARGTQLARHDAGGGDVRGALEGLPLTSHVCVEATLRGGEVYRRWYPDAPDGDGP